MKKQLLAIVFICISSISWSQINEIGVFIGGSNYIGDVGKSNYINPNNIAGGLIYKYNVNPRIALRGTLSFLSISGDDAESSNLVRVNRNFNFTNSIKEVAVGMYGEAKLYHFLKIAEIEASSGYQICSVGIY